MSIVVDELVKTYGDKRAVDGVSFEVAQGSFFALLGENGAGKSTTIGCMTTVYRPTSGSITVDGLQVGGESRKIRSSIGVVFQDSVLDARLSVQANLKLRGRLYPELAGARLTERIAELDAAVGLNDILGRKYGTLSGGQRRRADIARALLHNPTVLFLDEPTAGLDPSVREAVWHSVEELRDQLGITVVLTTHYLEEVDGADQVVVLRAGQKIAEGTPTTIRAKYARKRGTLYLRSTEHLAAMREYLSPHTDRCEAHGRRLTVDFSEGAAVMSLLQQVWPYLDDVELQNGTMEQAFLSLAEQGDSEGDRA